MTGTRRKSHLNLRRCPIKWSMLDTYTLPRRITLEKVPDYFDTKRERLEPGRCPFRVLKMVEYL